MAFANSTVKGCGYMPEAALLTMSGLLPVLFSACFYLMEKKTAFGRLPYRVRQALIGVSFGALAVFSTEFGIHIGGASINVRDAAPLAAGLIFGAPAGIIAGVIGGVERWFAALWGVGPYTRLACSLATVLAGVFGACARLYLFDNKKPGWFYSLAIGITTEVLHMLMIFLTNIGDTHNAFIYVRQCAGIMIAANSLSVMLSVLCVTRLSGEKASRLHRTKKIAQSFQRWLLVCVLAAFAVTNLFTQVIQTSISEASTDYILHLNTTDVRADIGDASDENLLSLTRTIAAALPKTPDSEALRQLAKGYGVSEINLVGEDGRIIVSTEATFIGYNMADGEQSAFFLPLLTGVQELVQSYQPIAYNAELSRKYAGVALASGGFLQVGYDAEQFQRDIDQQIVRATKNRHIGQEGCMIICNEDWTIISDRDGHEGESLKDIGLMIDEAGIEESERFSADIHGTPSYCAYQQSEGYYIVATLPVSEAVFSRDIAVYITAFMEIIVFAALFIHIYFLIKRLIVDNIRKVNSALAEITKGNLNVSVNVRTNEEFVSLSDDINATVTTLKAYITEASARIDKELEFARAIQQAALPSVFPPYPDRRDFDIYAQMDAAKEVGGDFYDFYFTDAHTFAFLIADVSGKGIPAAMFMMTSKTLIKGLAESGLAVNEVLTQANEKLCENNSAGMFVTAWMGVLDLRTGLLRYANAGHNPPAIRHSSGAFDFLRSKANFVLAGMNGIKYTQNELQLLPGDTLYLYTDGVTEAANASNELFSDDRLLKSLNADQQADMTSLCRGIKRDVDLFVDSAPQFDDITMLAFQLHALQNSGSLAVFPDAASAGLITSFLDKRLAALAVPAKDASKLRIAVDELYTNIRSYSGATCVWFSLTSDSGCISLRFQDNGTPYDPLGAAQPDITAPAEAREPGGLGILLVKKLMDDAAYEYTDGQNTLTLKLSICTQEG